MRFEFNGDGATVSISGEFTFTDHTAFLDLVNRLVGSKGPQIVIDSSQLEFIDSAGLGMLLIAKDEAGKVSRNLLLRKPQGQVKRMFAVTKFDTLFTVQS